MLNLGSDLLGVEWAGLGEVEESGKGSPVLCTHLNTVDPFQQDNAVGILENDEGRLETSRWVKYKIRGFSKLVRLYVDKYERLCFTLLLKNEQELEAVRVMKRGVVGVMGANACSCLGSMPQASGPGRRKGIATLFFNKQNIQTSLSI